MPHAAVPSQPSPESRLRLYRTLCALQRADHRPPTLRALARACGFRSSSTVSYHLRMLARLGLVTHRPGARGYLAVRR